MVTAFVNVCHKMAVAYLRVKSSNGKFDAARFGLTIDDFAYDAIAELFGRDTSSDCCSIEPMRWTKVQVRPADPLPNFEICLRKAYIGGSRR